MRRGETVLIAGQEIELDGEGYLRDCGCWSAEVAEVLAAEAGLQLSDEHWAVIDVLRQFYQEYQLSPAMRPLVKAVGLALGKDKGNSIYLMQLFPGSPAKLASKIAGLPKPSNCL